MRPWLDFYNQIGIIEARRERGANAKHEIRTENVDEGIQHEDWIPKRHAKGDAESGLLDRFKPTTFCWMFIN